MPVRYDPNNKLCSPEALSQGAHAVEAFADAYWKNYERLAKSGCEDPEKVDPFLFSRAVMAYTVENLPAQNNPKVSTILANMRHF